MDSGKLVSTHAKEKQTPTLRAWARRTLRTLGFERAFETDVLRTVIDRLLSPRFWLAMESWKDGELRKDTEPESRNPLLVDNTRTNRGYAGASYCKCEGNQLRHGSVGRGSARM